MNYSLPSFLSGVVSEKKYNDWVKKQADRHYTRDSDSKRNKAPPGTSKEDYQKMIHNAVIRSCGKDEYSGENMAWAKIGTYAGTSKKRDFKDLPTVDHEFDEKGDLLGFYITRWDTNDCKNDLSYFEWLEKCQKIIDHYKNKKGDESP